jgi:hypothetical protein
MVWTFVAREKLKYPTPWLHEPRTRNPESRLLMEIHRADKAYRTRSLLMLACTVALCGVLLWQLHQWLDTVRAGLMASDPDSARRWLRALLAGLGIALAVPALALGMSLGRLAFAARVEGRFPPRAWKTWRDVRVLRDAPALAWARRVELAGKVAFGLGAAFLAWALLAWWRYG